MAVYLRDAQGDLLPPPQRLNLPAIPARSPAGSHLLTIKKPVDASEREDFYTVIPELESPATPKLKHDSSTNNLIMRYRKMKKTP